MSRDESRPRVVIVGGGFAGLKCARGLARAPVLATLVDRRNHHVFQPLLYQVATAALSPAEIAAPIRGVLGRQRNLDVVLAEATRVDLGRRVLVLDDGEIAYDYLVLAAGATHSYFGRDDWAACAPGLKTLEDALEIRKRFLLAFERAEREREGSARAAWLTFVIVGAGPTGVEMAGAMVEIALRTIPREFRHADTRQTRVVLVEAQDRVLPSGFPAALSARAARDLADLGVEVRLATRVTEIDGDGVAITRDGKTERIAARNVIWAAGVRASSLGESLGVELDRAGRVVVGPDLSIPGHPEVFVVGDQALVKDAKTGGVVPGMAPGAMQMGSHVARVISREVVASAVPGAGPRDAFVYQDKGTLATIGRAKAVAHVFGRDFGGLPAWLLWAGLHIVYLISFRAKAIVLLNWIWAYVFFRRGARLITGERAVGRAGMDRTEAASDGKGVAPS
jgi:NADH:ubiquinone reductase (H+-translocating)